MARVAEDLPSFEDDRPEELFRFGSLLVEPLNLR